MKHIGSLAVLGAVLAASAPFASADILTLGSFATGVTPGSLSDSSGESAMTYNGMVPEVFSIPDPTPQPNQPPSTSPNASTYTLLPLTTWSANLPNSTWVGYSATAGPGGPNVPQGFYTFNETFTAVGGSYSGSITVQADDTTEVLLNGTPIMTFGAIGSDTHCAASQPNCSTPVDTLALTNIGLSAGTNTLTFIVEQAGDETVVNSDPSGIDFDATLTQNVVPEPNSLVLLGTGLMSAAGMLVRKRRTV